MNLFLSYLIVVLVGMTVLVVAIGLGIPSAFNRQVMPMMAGQNGMMNGHMGGMWQGGRGEFEGEQTGSLFVGFRRGVFDAVVPASIAAISTAFVVSLLVSRKVVAPVQAMTVASQRIADGHYSERVPALKGFIGVAQDELSHLAINFNQMAERLEQTEIMRRQLLADVAHELRTPLTSIKGSMEGLIDGVLPSETETYQLIYQEADRLQRIVLDLEELSRVEAGVYELKLESVAMPQLIESVVKKLGWQYEEKGVNMEIRLPGNLPSVRVDQDRIGQVLINLMGNALQYTPAGGRVIISGEISDTELIMKITDTGIGIASEHLPYIFDRFYRVDKSRSRAYGGSGIGLTIAKHWVEAHGGRIWAESEGLGKGCTFIFTIPLRNQVL
ncbi:MAG: HAMP domain-containing protein [Anaerolineae bacterium]|nr:HAMP domain-containing protein [Anaerolineae bacterium]